MRWTATIATNHVDQDGERFSDAALEQMAIQALFVPVTHNFKPPRIGSVVNSVFGDGVVSIEIDGLVSDDPGDMPQLYVVPAITFDPKDCTEENGVRVYHRVKVTSFGLTTDPSDPHLTPIREVER